MLYFLSFAWCLSFLFIFCFRRYLAFFVWVCLVTVFICLVCGFSVKIRMPILRIRTTGMNIIIFTFATMTSFNLTFPGLLCNK